MRIALALPALAALVLQAQDTACLGTWKLAVPTDIPAAIEKVTADMNFVTRPIARSRLKKLNPAYQRIVLARSGAEVTVQLDQRAPIRMPADGKAVAWTREDGETFQVSARPGPLEWVQHFQGEDGERTNVFRVDPATRALTLTVTVKSGKLPQPLTYTLGYVQAP